MFERGTFVVDPDRAYEFMPMPFEKSTIDVVTKRMKRKIMFLVFMLKTGEYPISQIQIDVANIWLDANIVSSHMIYAGHVGTHSIGPEMRLVRKLSCIDKTIHVCVRNTPVITAIHLPLFFACLDDQSNEWLTIDEKMGVAETAFPEFFH